MQPRPRIRGREPPPSGGRYRRRSPPPSPRHHRRAPPQPPRRSPELPRRLEVKPPPPIVGFDGDRRSRADVLLEAGRLAAHYLAAQGVIPEHVLHARENPEQHNNPSSRPEPPVRKRDDVYHDDDPRWRRNGGGGDWGRDKGGDDRLSRRSGWDRRSQSFDGRRKYNDGGSGGGDDDRFVRRSHVSDDQRRPAISRSYSHNDRRASSDDRRLSTDARLDRRRRSRSRSRSRSRTRTRSYHSGSRRDSDWRPGSGDLDHSKVPESGTVRRGNGHVDHEDAGQAARDLKAPRPMVVTEVAADGESHEDAEIDDDGESHEDAEVADDGESHGDAEMADDSASHEDAEMESEDHDQDECGDEDGGTAADGLNDGDADEINDTQHQLSNVDIVHPSEPVEETVHMQPQLSDVEGNREASIALLIDPVAENSGCSDVRDELEAPQSEIETDVGDLNRDEQELPAWYGIFDLNVAGTHDGCEMSEISTNPPVDNVCDYVPDLVDHMSQQTYYDTSENQGQDEHADDNQQLEDGQALLNQGIGTYDLNKNDLNDQQTLLNQSVDEHGHDNHQLEDEQVLLNNEETLLKQDAYEHEDCNHQMENEQMLLKQVSALDNYHVGGEQWLLSHATDEHSDDNHQIKNEQMLLNHASVHDLDNYDLNSEQMLLNNGADVSSTDGGQLKDGQMLLEHVADRQATPHNLGIGRMIPVINLEDDYKEQSDTKELLESNRDALRVDNVLPEHRYSQDKQTSSFPDHLQTNVPATSSLVTPNFGNRWTGRGAVNAQGIPGDDDVLYGTFDRIPLEVINVWDAPSSELGKSL